MPGKSKHKFPSYKSLEQNLKNGIFESFYFFIGSEDFLKDQILTKLRKLLQITPEGINNISLHHDAPNITDIFHELEMQSFFSENKLVVVKNADKLPNQILNQLKEILQRETLEAYIVFTSNSFPYRINTKGIDKIISRSYSFDVSKRDFRYFLHQFLKNVNKRMTDTAQDMILEMYTNLYDLHNNIEKLALVSDDREIIDENDLEIATTCSHDIHSFTFIDELAGRNITKTLRLLKELLSKGESFYSLIGLIRYHFINLLKAKQMLKKGTSKEKIFQDLWVAYFKRDLFMRQTQKFSLKKLFSNIQILSRFDHMSKTTSIIPEHLMQMLVIELCND
ncbi:MAG: DNA polymerase III subunit delta [Candidatus Aureabacteria bacterium]|nr:DNA polymerase III subunit delta [Candidatus Auribacterota bacterium]